MSDLPYDNLPPSPSPSYARAAIGEVRRSIERPSRIGVLILICLFLLPVSLVPASRGSLIRIPPLPTAWWTVYLMMAFGCVAVLFRIVASNRRPNTATTRLFWIPFVLLSGWQLVSLVWNGQENVFRWYSIIQSLAMCAATTAAFAMCSGLSFGRRMQIAGGLTVVIGGIVLVYAGLSFVFPSLRPSTEFLDRTSATLGFIRVFGPLGKPTTLNFIMLPALGVCIGMVYIPSILRPFWLGLALFFLAAIIGTGSRGGILCLGTFALLMVLFAGYRVLFVLIPGALALAAVVAVVGVPERFRSFEDSARFATYETGWYAYSQDPATILLGKGHGSLYSKLHDDTMRKMLSEDRWYLLDHRTEFGYSLRNSHSALLRSLYETGLPGLCLTIIPLTWVAFRPFSRGFRKAPQPYRTLLRTSWAGTVSVLPYFCFEEFFIASFWIVLIWSIYAVCMAESMEVIPEPQAARTRSPRGMPATH